MTNVDETNGITLRV